MAVNIFYGPYLSCAHKTLNQTMLRRASSHPTTCCRTWAHRVEQHLLNYNRLISQRVQFDRVSSYRITTFILNWHIHERI
jgi:hypothetical protein